MLKQLAIFCLIAQTERLEKHQNSKIYYISTTLKMFSRFQLLEILNFDSSFGLYAVTRDSANVVYSPNPNPNPH